jgi:hypothetical protein
MTHLTYHTIPLTLPPLKPIHPIRTVVRIPFVQHHKKLIRVTIFVCVLVVCVAVHEPHITLYALFTKLLDVTTDVISDRAAPDARLLGDDQG